MGDVPASATNEYTFEVTAGARLEFAELAGSLTIQTAPSGPIKAVATKRSFGTDKESAQREISSFDVKVEQREGVISFGLAGPARPRRRVDYRITTPPDMSVKVGGGSGSVTISGLHGAVNIAGENVSVLLQDIRGPIAIQNKMGDIRITSSIGRTLIRSRASTVQIDRLTAETLDVDTGANVVIRDSGSEGDAGFKVRKGDLTLTRFRAATLTAEASQGRINVNESHAQVMDLQTRAGKISLFRVSAGTVRAATVTGHLDINETQGDLKLNTQAGAVSLSEVRATGLSIAAGTGNVSFDGSLPEAGEHSIRTSSGNIYAYLAKESAFQLDAATKGSITLDPPFMLEGAARRPGHWRGTINQGTALLALNSSSGEIWISPR